MARQSFALLVVTTLCASYTAHGYELTTHQKLSEAAVDESALVKTPAVLQDLGLSSPVAFSLQLEGRPISVRQIVGEGARREDTLTQSRPIHHFFDPTRAGETNNGALRLPVPVIPTYSSPTWALQIGLGYSEYAIVREIKGLRRVSFIQFIQQADSLWRIESM